MTPTTAGSWTFASELELVNPGLNQARREAPIASTIDSASDLISDSRFTKTS